jgi:hypothetical protein
VGKIDEIPGFDGKNGNLVKRAKDWPKVTDRVYIRSRQTGDRNSGEGRWILAHRCFSPDQVSGGRFLFGIGARA